MRLIGTRVQKPLDKFELPSTDPEQEGYNALIANRIESGDTEGKERIEDALQLALWLQQSHFNATVRVSSAPFILIEGHTDLGVYKISLGHGSSDLNVGGSSLMVFESTPERFELAKELYFLWKLIVRHLPEGYVIYGPDVTGQGGQDFDHRDSLLQWVGFGATDENGHRFGIVKGGVVTPLSSEDFFQMSGEEGIGVLYKQRFMAEQISWSEEV